MGSNLSKKSTFSSLKYRNFRLYFWTQLVSNSGNWLTNVALTLLVLKVAGTGVSIGWLVACQYGPLFFLTAWGGAIADRSDKRKMLLLTQTLEMLQSTALAVLAFMHHPPLSAFYVLALCGGVLLSLDNPLRRSFVSEMVGPEELSNAVVMYSAIVNISRVVGPTFAGLLVGTAGFGWCFTIDAISYGAVIFGLFLMRPSELFRGELKSASKGAVREGIRYIFANKNLLLSFAMLTLIGTLAYNFTVTFPLFTSKTLHKSSQTFTLIYSVYGFGSVVSALLLAKRAFVELKHAIWGAFGLGISLICFALSPNIYIALVLAIAVGLSSVLFMTASTAFVQMKAAPEVRGRVLSLQMVITAGSMPIGGPLVGWIADTYGGRAPLILGGVAAIVASSIGFFFTR
jgi:MFS family permease